MGAKNYLIDKETGERIGPGSHEIWKTPRGYKGKTGAGTYWIEKHGLSGNAQSKLSSLLKPGEPDIEEHLEPEEDRETVMETKVGVPGLNAYRNVEEYKSEEGVKVRERRIELRILGFPVTLDYGEVKGEVLNDEELEELAD